MPSSLLTFLKYIFLAVLYLFFLRVLRAVWIELRDPKVVPAGAGAAPSPAGSPAARPAPPQPVERLTVVAPVERAGHVYHLGEELTVGRAPGCGVSLADDSFVSQLHARVFRRDGEYFVEDLGSTNGTLLNNHKVAAPVALRPGDRLQIGKTVLELAR
ncbi:MAG TPA: FHA domain-containing protein [Acidimicrobiales bacterium]|jgi:pSer/pThr/pTyr-binding forkhead associated (FHA) protein|nr:FHA domain-containing protein [Acidimicrobiales bacterium]